MSENQLKMVEKIRDEYVEKKATKLDELKQLHKRAERPAEVFAYVFGSIGSLVMGAGMSLIMEGAALSFAMPVGLALGIVGLAMVSVNYFIYKKILAKSKKKYAAQILELTNELLNK